jgi:hypothetical protein
MARWLHRAWAIVACAAAASAMVLAPGACRAQALDQGKVADLYAAAKREGSVIIWGTQRR